MALPPGRSGAAGAPSLGASNRASARLLRTRPPPARIAGAAAFSPPRLASRDPCEPPPNPGRTRSPSLSAPAPFPHRNRSGEGGGGGEGARLETGEARVRKVSGALCAPGLGVSLAGNAAAADFWEAQALPASLPASQHADSSSWRSHFSGGNLRGERAKETRSSHHPCKSGAGSVWKNWGWSGGKHRRVPFSFPTPPNQSSAGAPRVLRKDVRFWNLDSGLRNRSVPEVSRGVKAGLFSLPSRVPLTSPAVIVTPPPCV